MHGVKFKRITAHFIYTQSLMLLEGQLYLFSDYGKVPKRALVTVRISRPKGPQLSSLSGSRYFRAVIIRE